jgi:hypothetical protein
VLNHNEGRCGLHLDWSDHGAALTRRLGSSLGACKKGVCLIDKARLNTIHVVMLLACF